MFCQRYVRSLRGVPDVDFRVLPSIQGHDSFLVDMDRFRPAVASFFCLP